MSLHSEKLSFLRSFVKPNIKQRFIISVIALTICPLLVMSFIMTHQTTSVLLAYYKEQDYAKTVSNVNLFELQIDSIMNTRLTLSMDKDIADHYSTDNLQGIYDLRKNMRKLSAAQPCIKEVYLFIPSDPLFFSTKSSYSVTTFCNKYGIGEEMFTDAVNHCEYPGTVRYAMNHYTLLESLLFFLPIPGSASNHILIVDVSVANISNLFVSNVENSEELFIAVDLKNENGFFVNNPVAKSELTIENILQAINGFPIEFIQQEAKINNRGYLITSVVVPSFPLRLLKVIPNEFLVSKTIERKSQWVVAVLLVSLSALFLFLFSSSILFKPLTKLTKYISSRGWTSNSKNSEVEYVRSYLMHINEQNDQLNSEIQYLQSVHKRDILIRLFDGLVENNIELAPLFSDFPPTLWSNTDFKYFVYAVRTRQDSPSSAIMSKVSDLFGKTPEMHSVCFQYLQHYLMGIAIITSNRFTPSDSFFVSCADAVNDLLHHQCILGVGGEYIDPIFGPQALIEAVCSCDNNEHSDAATVMFNMGASNIDYEDMISLLSDISKLNEISDELLARTVSEARNIIKNKEISFGNARYLCFKTIYALWSLSKIYSCETADGKLPMNEIILCLNRDDLCSFIQVYSDGFFTRLEESKTRKQSILYNEMLVYLEKQIPNMDFSLQNMAGHFSMSLPIMTKYFKDRNGKSIADYLANLRLQRACELLEQTTLTVKEIGEAIGYNNVTSFIRRFRSDMGITPGQYRDDSDKYRK